MLIHQSQDRACNVLNKKSLYWEYQRLIEQHILGINL